MADAEPDQGTARAPGSDGWHAPRGAPPGASLAARVASNWHWLVLGGWTLAWFAILAPGLDGALDRFDELVASAGGRVYLSKDVRMRAPALDAMYPRLDEWREVREAADPDRLWRSDLALRTGLIREGS